VGPAPRPAPPRPGPGGRPGDHGRDRAPPAFLIQVAAARSAARPGAGPEVAHRELLQPGCPRSQRWPRTACPPAGRCRTRWPGPLPPPGQQVELQAAQADHMQGRGHEHVPRAVAAAPAAVREHHHPRARPGWSAVPAADLPGHDDDVRSTEGAAAGDSRPFPDWRSSSTTSASPVWRSPGTTGRWPGTARHLRGEHLVGRAGQRVEGGCGATGTASTTRAARAPAPPACRPRGRPGRDPVVHHDRGLAGQRDPR